MHKSVKCKRVKRLSREREWERRSREDEPVESFPRERIGTPEIFELPKLTKRWSQEGMKREIEERGRVFPHLTKRELVR